MFRPRIYWMWAMIVPAFAVSTSSAAAINFEWRVGGTKLEAGETRGFTSSRDGNADLHGSVGGVGALLLSNKGKVAAGARIIGGIPGTGEETLELESVTFDPPLQTCGVIQGGGAAGTIRTVPLETELVEGAPGGISNGEVLVLVKPKVGETFATFELTGASCPEKGSVPAVTGLFLGLPLPQKAEVVKVAGDEEAITKEYKIHGGTGTLTAGLKFAGSAATLTGLVLVVLESGNADAAF